MRKETKELFDMISDYDISTNFEETLNNKSSEFGIGYFHVDVERDENNDVKVIMRVAAMVDTAGEEDFKNNKELNTVTIEYPDYDKSIKFKVTEVVPVSGMELEVIYEPV